MEEQEAEELWNVHLSGASVLPAYLARIMMLEREASELIIDIELCEEEMKKIPASHKKQ